MDEVSQGRSQPDEKTHSTQDLMGWLEAAEKVAEDFITKWLVARDSLDWAMARTSNMPERYGNAQEAGSPKRTTVID